MITEKNHLRHLVNKRQVFLKDVYYLIIQSSIKNREAKQSRFLHDNHYDEKLNSLCHTYMLIEYPKRK